MTHKRATEVSLITPAQITEIVQFMQNDNGATINPIDAIVNARLYNEDTLRLAGYIYNKYLCAGTANILLNKRSYACPNWKHTCLRTFRAKLIREVYKDLPIEEIEDMIDDYNRRT